jgi:hypothetical protein
MLALEDVIVRAANADMADRKPSPSGRRPTGGGALDDFEDAWLLAKHGFHEGVSHL